ncbi:hypothetical protein GGI08_001924 [Coemansia sp. S2]|nr:hypothetical protein LPJ71_001283 [Coemansia sp. S17]KAJ2066336.1 hypothetical protein GGI08_001924 [Coemansia sp. S2]KAJ2072654.1 hypothetical protein GGH13_002539 [Coemansia sp. S155-1]KAJ2351393.1 hypothetical protein GGH92_001854 [Coemansia sp. RSA 2673]KAJ2417395.1 hypothetical protein GGF41_005393 [Coemansia sp. RSA 2531]
MLVTTLARITAAAATAGLTIAAYIEPYVEHTETTLEYPPSITRGPGTEWAHATWAVATEGQADSRTQEVHGTAAGRHSEGSDSILVVNHSSELGELSAVEGNNNHNSEGEKSSSPSQNSAQHSSHANAATTLSLGRSGNETAPSLILAITMSAVTCASYMLF